MNIPTRIRRILLGAALAFAALAPAALSGQAEAATPPTIGFLIYPSGTSAIVEIVNSEPTTVRVAYTSVTPASAAQQASDTPTGSHKLKLTGLTSNTEYSITATARTPDGRTATASTRFTTVPKRVRVTLESIDITDDGDGFLTGDGEPQWLVSLGWTGRPPAGFYCYPLRCGDHGTYSEGRITPTNSAGETLQFVFAEENFDRFPDAISLLASASEDDGGGALQMSGLPGLWDCIANGGCTAGAESATVWRVPRGVETAVQTLKVSGDDSDTGFRSVLNFAVVLFHNDTPYPAPQRDMPSSNWK